ncbi:MAG: LamG domain-containing protein [Planctomycetes bacterium]|nr:LamG domain-containing protein [Planctomycetota bacterium]
MCRKFICLVTLISVLSIAAGTANAHLVAYWPMDEGTGTTVGDITGSWDGTITGDVTWVDGKEGMALEFPGGQNYVDCGNVDIGPDLTLAYWCFNPEKTFERSIGQHSGNYTADPGWAVYSRDEGEGTVWFRIHGADNAWDGGDIIIPDTLPKTDWYHLTFTFEGATRELKGYLNGELKVSKICEEGRSIYPNTNDLRMGHIGTGEPFAGMLDEVAVWNHVLTEDEILAVMQGHMGGANPNASRPKPADGALHSDTWVNLSWSPGAYAVSHDIYLGEVFDDVNSSAENTFVGNQGGTFIVVGFPGFPYPDGLVPGTTYYWRIDEVNDTEPNSPWKGDVWSFGIPPKTAYAPEPADTAESVELDADLNWTAGFGAKLHTVYFGDNFADVSNAAGGVAQGAATYSPGPLELAKTYYWRVDEFDVIETHKGDVWSFTTVGAVGNPNPAKGTVDVLQTPVLTWVPGVYADSHQVYLGTDKAAVKNADTSSPEFKGTGNLGSESYDAGNLEWDTTYYWRIDEANNANADSPWTGPLWSFTTANFLIIDDFEGYNDLDPDDPASNRIFLAWVDGFDNPAINGSVVGYANPPFAEQTIVHGGNQSMPMAYDNAVGKSEATLTLTSMRDWTVNGINTLTIWFRGEAANAAETMHVVLNDSAAVTNDNPDAAQKTSWTQWNIDLQRFADQGVNLANVNSITLGLGNRNNPVAGGSGMMYFDDIRLYPLP